MSRTIKISGPDSLSGTLNIPGDKSISHRVAMLASLASGRSEIGGFATSADCLTTLECLRGLGVDVELDGPVLRIHGKGLRGYRPAEERVSLDAGNSGSTIRILSGLLAAQNFTSVIDGDESLRLRPMARIIEPLALMGGRIEAREGRYAPLTIYGRDLAPISYESRVASAQIKSCVLFAGLYAGGRTTFREPAPSRNHTELMLPVFGAEVETGEDGRFRIAAVKGCDQLNPVYYRVPGDISSAAFFIAAAALLPGSEIVIKNVGLNPTRSAFLEVLKDLGADISRENVFENHGELVGDLLVRGRRLGTAPEGMVLSGEIIPNIIDEIPVLAVVATQTEGRLEVRDAKELRVKESDRIRTVVDGLRALGGRVEEFEDGFSIGGPQRLKGGRVETAGDHRIAMAFSMAGLMAEGTTEIADADCARVSFPEFYDLLAAATSGI
ncbi:MAG: 3-phosphoshikimate 1-carboxyvinyltransferase [Blastocatellia bacterium]|nr:3-phosphoshikimate 1-carboxyvinyltransferase [Blastocatellia bacterium]